MPSKRCDSCIAVGTVVHECGPVVAGPGANRVFLSIAMTATVTEGQVIVAELDVGTRNMGYRNERPFQHETLTPLALTSLASRKRGTGHYRRSHSCCERGLRCALIARRIEQTHSLVKSRVEIRGV